MQKLSEETKQTLAKLLEYADQQGINTQDYMTDGKIDIAKLGSLLGTDFLTQ